MDDLSCKPQIVHTILAEPGIKEALDGKLLISILAGVTMRQITGWVLPTTRVVRAMPNTPCKVGHLKSYQFCSSFLTVSIRFVKA